MNLALFDFDGTITFKDSFIPFLSSAVSPARKRCGVVLLSPLMVGYQLGITSPSRTRSIIAAFALRRRQLSEIREIGSRYAREVLPGFIRRKALERIAWHQTQGDTVVVVSAALDVYLTSWCTERQLDVICTELEVVNGAITGRYHRGDCVGPEKLRRIKEKYRLTDFSAIYAYGDTVDDCDMLSVADHKYFRWKRIDASDPPRSDCRALG